MLLALAGKLLSFGHRRRFPAAVRSLHVLGFESSCGPIFQSFNPAAHPVGKGGQTFLHSAHL
jgi:hypothetical protein